MRKLGTGLLITGVALAGCQNKKNEQQEGDKPMKKPNLIIFQADDLGFDDLAINGNQYVSTPNLDKMAREGLQFSNFYVNPVCAPTRASLLTGRNFLRTGVSHVHGGKDFINLNETLVGEVLKEAGYVTGMWGKWHSGTAPGYYPWDRGFDEAYRAKLYQHENNTGYLNNQYVEHDKWADDVITRYAVDFIERNKDTAFFAYLSFLTCHGPLEAPEPYIKKYEKMGLSRGLATIYGMIEHMDFYLARVFAKLDELGLSDNTIVMFMSDNGPAILNNDLTDKDREIRYHHNYNGHKGNIWENGVKSPLFVWCPGSISPGTTGVLTDVTDIFPTLAELAGVNYTNPDFPLDGTSFADILSDSSIDQRDKISYNYAHVAWIPTKKPWSGEGFYNEYQPVDKDTLKSREQVISIRTREYKLLYNPGHYKNTPEQVHDKVLIDMVNDPTEKHNIIEEKPEIAEELATKLDQWFEGVVNEPNSFEMPVFNVGTEVESVIHGKAPYTISEGMKNTFNLLSKWSENDMATYKIKVNEPTDYLVTFYLENGDTPGVETYLSSSGKELISGKLDSDTSTLGTIYLTPGDSLLEVRFSSANKMNNNLILNGFNKIVLEKTGQNETE